MLPHAAAKKLRDLGHDATSVTEAGMGGAPDEDVFTYAVTEERFLVTENVADYAGLLDERLRRDDPCVPVVFVRRDELGRPGSLAANLARHLHRWASANPEPYLGPHWP